MENDTRPLTLIDRVEILRRRWVYPALITPSCLLIAIFTAFAITPMYRSSGTVILEPSSVPKELVATATSYADQQFELIQRRVMTTDSLLTVIAKVDPYPQLDASPAEKARMVADATEIERVDPVTLETLAESNAFSIHYGNPDPKIAAEVTKALVALFLDYNSKTQRERAAGIYRFLLAESGKIRKSIQGMEARLEQFKTRYGDALPEAQTRNLTSLDAARRDYESAQAQVRLAQEKVSLLELQLGDMSPTLVGAVSDRRTELATLRAELADAEKRYTPEHPDVRRLRRAVQELVAQGRTTPNPSVRPDNPEYLRVASQLDAARRDLAALRATSSRASSQMTVHSRSLQLAPSVEREYAQLARDYTLAQENFREIQAKLTEAGLTQALVTEQQGERFTLIRTPAESSSPHSPNRLGIILLGLVFGTALGLGMAMFVEFSDPTVRGTADLLHLTGHTMIAAVPVLLNRADERARRFRLTSTTVAFGIALLVVTAAVLS